MANLAVIIQQLKKERANAQGVVTRLDAALEALGHLGSRNSSSRPRRKMSDVFEVDHDPARHRRLEEYVELSTEHLDRIIVVQIFDLRRDYQNVLDDLVFDLAYGLNVDQRGSIARFAVRVLIAVRLRYSGMKPVGDLGLDLRWASRRVCDQNSRHNRADLDAIAVMDFVLTIPERPPVQYRAVGASQVAHEWSTLATLDGRV